MQNETKDNVELVINTAMQMIPVIGSPLATLYFGNKQNKQFRRLEQTIKEIASELKGMQMPSISAHNEEELLSMVEQLNDKIEKEFIEQKRVLYKNFYKKILISPNSNNYSERKMFLDILGELTPLQIELVIFFAQNSQPIIDVDISHPAYSQSVILGSISQLKNYGLIKGYVNSIQIGGNQGGIKENLVISDFGRTFNSFCLSD